MKKRAKARINQQGTRDESCKKRPPDLAQEYEGRKRKQRLNNQRTVYVKKATALRLEKRFKQYPKQKFSEIVDRLLKGCLKNINTTASDPPNNLQQTSD